VQLTLFRVLQECLSNSAKHAQARSVDVKIAYGADHVVLSVRDDGKGFDAARTPAGHYGLLNMRERAMKVGGQLIVDTAPGKGSHITLQIPFSP
jgi:signal transduction histidine kinase